MLQEIETTSNVNLNNVSMSDSAIEAVRDILNQRKLEGYSLRVYVAGGGCCGVNFGMALDNNIRENDVTFRNQDVNVVVDDQSIPYLYGAKIDFINDPVRGAGFIVDSPSSSKSGGCSCGSEGHSHDSTEESSCACGGSCSCNN